MAVRIFFAKKKFLLPNIQLPLKNCTRKIRNRLFIFTSFIVGIAAHFSCEFSTDRRGCLDFSPLCVPAIAAAQRPTLKRLNHRSFIDNQKYMGNVIKIFNRIGIQ